MKLKPLTQTKLLEQTKPLQQTRPLRKTMRNSLVKLVQIRKLSQIKWIAAPLLLSATLFPVMLSPTVYAQDLEDDLSLQTPEDQRPISATQFLQSLKDIPTNQSFSAPYVQQIYTDQKVRTLLVESHSLPIVDIQLTFNAGSARDETIGKGLFGLSHLTAQLLNEGTATQTTDEIAQEFERLGVQYQAQAYRDMFIVKIRVLSDEKRLTPAIHQLILLLKGASFPQSSIQRLLSNAQVGQKQVKENPSRTMSVRFYRAVYGDHPYAEPTTGTIQSLRRISSQDIRNFRDRYLVANNLNIAITGDLNSIQAKKIANLISSNLPVGEPAPALSDAQPMQQQTLINIPFDSTQAHVMMGQLSIKRDDPDRFNLDIGNQIFGSGGFNSLLMRELREKRGYTYSASSNLVSMQSQGLFSLSYSTHRDQLYDSIGIAYQTLLDFLYRPLNPQLVEETKMGMLRAFPQMLSSNASINAQLGAIGFYQLPSNYLSEYPTYISSVTTEDIQRAWRKHIDPQKLLTITVGKDIDRDQIVKIYQQKLLDYRLISPPTPVSTDSQGANPQTDPVQSSSIQSSSIQSSSIQSSSIQSDDTQSSNRISKDTENTAGQNNKAQDVSVQTNTASDQPAQSRSQLNNRNEDATTQNINSNQNTKPDQNTMSNQTIASKTTQPNNPEQTTLNNGN